MIPHITSMKGAYDIAGKTVVITGGNGGIGLGIAKAMADCGANIAIFCRNMDKAKNALEELKSFNVKSKAYFCDILKIDNVRDAVDATCKEFDNIDILINNSGIGNKTKFLDMDPELEEWRQVVETDLSGMAHVTYEVGKRMRSAGKGGSVINITSNAGFIVNKGVTLSAYAAAKAGANSLTKTLAYELGEYNIRVNAIAPGYVHVGPLADYSANPELGDLVNGLIREQQPLKRLVEAIEIGALAIYLASPAAAHITGQTIIIDGGYTLAY